MLRKCVYVFELNNELILIFTTDWFWLESRLFWEFFQCSLLFFSLYVFWVYFSSRFVSSTVVFFQYSNSIENVLFPVCSFPVCSYSSVIIFKSAHFQSSLLITAYSLQSVRSSPISVFFSVFFNSVHLFTSGSTP